MKATLYSLFFLRILLISQATYTGYKYGENVENFKWCGGYPKPYVLAWYNTNDGINTIEDCKQKCTDWNPANTGLNGVTNQKCTTWAYKESQNHGCGIGGSNPNSPDPDQTEPPLCPDPDQNYISGWNKDVCDDALDCYENDVCSSWSDEPWAITGSRRTLASGRCYYAYVPDECRGSSARPCKVVFNFSGVKKNAYPWALDRIQFTEYVTGVASGSSSWNGQDEPGIVIYPQRYAKKGGWQFLPGRSGMCTTYDDVAYTNEILTDLANIGVKRDKGVYAAGHGNGGHFVFDLAARLEDAYGVVLSAIGTYSGNSLTDHGGIKFEDSALPWHDLTDIEEGTVQVPQTKLSVLIVQGYNDITHEYWGHPTEGCDMGKIDSQTLTRWWGKVMECDESPYIQYYSGNCGNNCEKMTKYTNCDSGVDIWLQSTNSGYTWEQNGDPAFPDFFRNH